MDKRGTIDASADDPEVRKIERLVREGGESLLTEEELEIYQHFYPRNADPEEHHYANIAESLDESTLATIGRRVCEWYETDRTSREPWYERMEQGIKALGVSTDVDGGADFEGASVVVHPLLSEACVQFQARAIAETWPAEGPVRTTIIGKVTEEKTAQADRVREYMNYLYSKAMPGAYDEEDSLLYRLPIEGSMFKKVNYDPEYGVVRSYMVKPQDFIVPYNATSLYTAPRYIHVLRYHRNRVRRLMYSGFWLDIGTVRAADESYTRTSIDEAEDDVESRYATDWDDEGQRMTFFECHCELDIPGFEDKDDKGKKTGVALPYVVTVDFDQQRTVAIRRNWREEDRGKRKRVWFTHKKFLPGLGFYGHGFYHAIGGLSQAATGALRALLDSAAFSNLQGGFRSRDVRLAGKGGDKPLAPGELRETEATAEELDKGIKFVEYPEPSRTLYELLGYLDERGQRFASTTDVNVGEFKANMPVGTTLALIEQGAKVFSGIHKRLHAANAREYQLAADVFSEFMPAEYPYDVAGEERIIKRADFDGRVDILPVSDPNLVSSTHRIVLGQAVLDLSERSPDLYKKVEVHRQLLSAMRVPNIDAILSDPSKKIRRDPVSENMAFMMREPVTAVPDQDHEAHLRVHDHWFMALPPDLQEALAPMYQAHNAEHLAYLYRLRIMEQLSITLPEFQSGDDEDMPELPPDLENQIAYEVAQGVQQLEEAIAQQEKPPSPEEQLLQAEIDRKDKEAEAEIARKDRESEAAIERKRREFEAEQRMKADADERERQRQLADDARQREQEDADRARETDKSENMQAATKQLAEIAKSLEASNKMRDRIIARLQDMGVDDLADLLDEGDGQG